MKERSSKLSHTRQYLSNQHDISAIHRAQTNVWHSCCGRFAASLCSLALFFSVRRRGTSSSMFDVFCFTFMLCAQHSFVCVGRLLLFVHTLRQTHTKKTPMLWRQPNSAMSSVCGPACSGTRLESTGAAFGPLSIPIMIDQSMNMFIYYMAVVMALRDRRAHRPSDRLWNNRWAIIERNQGRA